MRLISLCPSLTELLFDLDLGSSVVGRTKFCIHPQPAVESVEKVGGTKNPKIDRIVELEPDLVLLNEEENRIEDAEALASAGVPCHVSMPRDVAETATMVRSIGAAVGRATAAEEIAADMESRAARVRESSEVESRVSFAYLIWREPLMTLNADTFVSAMLSLPGGRNVFAEEPDRYPEVTPEKLAASCPDRIFLSSEPFPFSETHAEELCAMTGLSRDRFRLADGEMLSWHGSRTPAGIDYADMLIREARSASG